MARAAGSRTPAGPGGRSPLGECWDRSSSCPCGSDSYAECCAPLHHGGEASTAEALMRSRYSAYALGLTDHLWRTWHPRTRPDRVTSHDALTWHGLRVLSVTDGGPDDVAGTVLFEAASDGPDGPAVVREDSRFERRAGRWRYLGTTDG